MKSRIARRSFAVISWLMLFGSIASAQQLAVKPTPRAFEPGEVLTYKAEVSRSLLRKMDVATFKFSADRMTAVNTAGDNSQLNSVAPNLKFTGDVISDGFFTRLFNIRFHQHIESTVDPESLAVLKTVKLDEQGKRVRSSEANFEQQKGKVVWIEKDPNDPARVPRTVSADYTGRVQDVLSAIYYLRTLPLEVGKSFELSVSDSGRVYVIPVRVMEKKRLKTVLGQISVVRIEPALFGERGLVKFKGQISIWLTDDHRHVPVKAQLKSEYGTFDITLKKVSQQSAN